MRIRKSWSVAAGAVLVACAGRMILADTGNFEESAPRQLNALSAESSITGQRVAAGSVQMQADSVAAESDEQDTGPCCKPPPPNPRPGPKPPRPGPKPPRPNPKPPRPGPRPPKPGPHPRPNPGPHPIPHPGHQAGDWNRWQGHRGWVYRGPWFWYDYPWGWGWHWWGWRPWPGQIACDIHYRNLYSLCTDECSGEYDQCVAACNGAGDCVDQCSQNMNSCDYGCESDYEENLRNVCGIVVP